MQVTFCKDYEKVDFGEVSLRRQLGVKTWRRFTNGEHFVRVGDLQAGVQFHFAFSKARGLHFLSAQAVPGEPPRLDLPKEPPEQILGQVTHYAREKGWL